MEYLADLDRQMSKKLSVYNGYFDYGTVKTLKFVYQILEWSGHGVPWLIATVLLICFPAWKKREFYMILLVGLIFDLIVIAILKLFFQRPRPHYNEDNMLMSISKVDDYSFPSGHTTRAFMLLFLMMYSDVDDFIWRILLGWAFLLGFSRVSLGRHHISDVIAGAVVGVAQAYVVEHYLWDILSDLID